MSFQNYDSFSELVKTSRSVRRFSKGAGITRELLTAFVDIARYTPATANFQPLKYKVFTEKSDLDDIFPRLKWAGLLKDKFVLQTYDERPEGYIAIFTDSNILPHEKCGIDVGISAQTIMLAARSAGISGCILAAFDKDAFAKSLSLPENLSPALILAFGKSAEMITVEDAENGRVAYYRDENDVHHVPKRPISEIIF